MAKGYWIARIDVADAETYKSYVAAATPAIPGTATAVALSAANAQAATRCFLCRVINGCRRREAPH